jgi:hypothetical protein
MADDVYIGNQRGTKFKADVVGGKAILGVKLVVGADNTDGGYIDSINSKMRVVSNPYLLEVGQGNIAAHSAVRVFGTNDSAGAAFETVSEIQGLYSYLSSAEILKVSSTDVDDDGDPVDTGARTLKIWGLDSSWDEVDDTITLNGTTAVSTNISFLRVYRAKVLTAGATGTNEGIISINDNADAVTLLQCQAGEGGNSDCIYPVPNGKKLIITKFRGGAIGAQNATLHLMCRPFGGAFVTEHEISLKDGFAEVNFDTGIICAAKSDIEVRVQGSASPPAVSASFEGWIEDE